MVLKMSPAALSGKCLLKLPSNISFLIHGSYSRYSTFNVNQCLFKKILETRHNISKLNNATVVRWFKRNPNVRIGLTPIQKVSEEPGNFRKLLKPFLFTIGVCGASYAGSAIWQYENLRSEAIKQMREHKMGIFKKPLSYKQGELRRHINAWWNSLSEGEQLAIEIISANALVFGAWRIKGFQRFMIRYFSSNPSSKSVCLPMVLSTFSHFSFFHLAANMYVLFSFSGIAGKLFGKEQFLGFYLSAGVVSSFASYVHKIATKTLSPSLGASGALMAILAPICVKYPDAKISIVFLPFLTFSAGSAIACVMGIDALGLILGWRFFDHAAHLGGALFGIGYLYLGQDYIWKNREPIMMWWHKLREGVK